ncbi:hypothetical protein Q1695_000818 [Nippostrongylus brasiliensis]|nr:hypothetical protein Q1695_000818 [Nippostrongylus brasiliensis]
MPKFIIIASLLQQRSVMERCVIPEPRAHGSYAKKFLKSVYLGTLSGLTNDSSECYLSRDDGFVFLVHVRLTVLRKLTKTPKDL